MDIQIKNYQRLEDVEINLQTGITVITGGSNHGKSSTVRAIRDFIFNKFTNDKIRHGEKEITVAINDVIATRKAGSTKYNIKGQELIKVGRNPLKEVFDEFKIGETEVNGISIKPNFWFQMDKPFIFDKTPGQKNDLIIGSKNDRYLTALKSIKSKQLYLSKTEKKSLIDSINLLKSQNLATERELQKLDGIDEIHKLAIELSELENNLSSIESKFTSIEKSEDSKNNIQNKLSKIDELVSEYSVYLNLVEEAKDIDQLMLSLEKLDREKAKENTLESDIKEFDSKINEFNALEKEFSSLNDSSETIKGISELFSNAKKHKGEMVSYKSKIDIIANELNKKIELISSVEKCPLCGSRLEEDDEHGC